MESAIRKFISEFDASPMVSGRNLRSLLEKDRTSFFDAALPVLRQGGDSASFQFLLAMLLNQGLLLTSLCDPRLFTLDEATTIARQTMQVEPQFDVRLVRTLVQNQGGTSPKVLERIVSTESGTRLLEIVAVVSDGMRVLPFMTRLLSHPDVRVRAKAALLVGRSNKNHKWVQQRLGETDARVRANLVESLWGDDTAGSRAVFWNALGDGDCHVAGNGVLGLYRLGEPASVRLILQLMSHLEAEFRMSGLWVMGETGDPRFMPTLARIISGPEPELRGNALRAMAKLKKAMTKRTSGAPLSLSVGPARRAEDNWAEFTAGVLCGHGQNIPGLGAPNFALWEDSTLVTEYRVRQRGRHEPVAIAVAFPRLLERACPLLEIQEKSIEQALRHKRKQDLWTVLKYVTAAQEQPGSTFSAGLSPADEDLSIARMRFTNNAEDISNAVATPGRRLGCASDLHQATRTLIEATAQLRAARNIVLICQASVDTFTRDVREEVLAAEMTGVAVHIISPWPSGVMKELCSRTGGMLLTPASPDGIPEALTGLCAGLLNSYEVRYRPENPGASKLRLQVYTDTLMGEGLLNLQ